MNTPLEASKQGSTFLANLHHAYAQTDGTYAFPNSREGDLLKQAKREIEALRKALRPIALYAEKRMAKPIPNLGDSVHAIHTGTEWEAEITFTHCKRAAKVLGRPSSS